LTVCAACAFETGIASAPVHHRHGNWGSGGGRRSDAIENYLQVASENGNGSGNAQGEEERVRSVHRSALLLGLRQAHKRGEGGGSRLLHEGKASDGERTEKVTAYAWAGTVS
jgi:hypothetical protein